MTRHDLMRSHATIATPHRYTRRPRINGQQVALIAGPAGEEIFTNKYGQVKVWFPWDRRARKDGTDTVWIRVGQPWAGGTWGHQVIPRVGMECLVSYQEGDPDRPFVMALVPDPTNPVPYPLPDNKTRMVFRSNSYKSTGFNEMTFEDKTSGENMFFHAQKDHTSRIENNVTQSIGANQSNSIGQNQAITIGQNATQEVGQSMNLTVGGTGANATALMGPLASLAAQTSGMVTQALGATDGGGSGMSAVMSMIPSIASAAMGMLGAAGQQAQSGVVGPASTRPDAGTALAASGAALGQAAGGLFSMPGMLNTTVGTMRTDNIGVAHAEQIGVSKVTNVGQSFTTQVGKAWGLTVVETAAMNVGQTHILKVGQTSQEEVGQMKTVLAGQTLNLGAGNTITLVAGDASKCSLSLDQSGTLILEASNQIILRGGGGASMTVGPGPVLYTPALVQGAAPPCPECLRAMSVDSVPFVQP